MQTFSSHEVRFANEGIQRFNGHSWLKHVILFSTLIWPNCSNVKSQIKYKWFTPSFLFMNIFLELFKYTYPYWKLFFNILWYQNNLKKEWKKRIISNKWGHWIEKLLFLFWCLNIWVLSYFGCAFVCIYVTQQT